MNSRIKPPDVLVRHIQGFSQNPNIYTHPEKPEIHGIYLNIIKVIYRKHAANIILNWQNSKHFH